MRIIVSLALLFALGAGADAACRSDAAQRIPITGFQGSLQNPCFSPAGDQLAITNFTTRYNTGYAIVKTVLLSGGNPLLRLSPAAAQSVNLPGQCWSAASNLVTYSSDVVARDEIYIVPATGGSPVRITNRPGYLSWEPSLSPVLADGSQWIVFESHRNQTPLGPGQLWKVRIDGSGLTRITSGADDRQPQWSPTGLKVVFQRQLSAGYWDVMTADPDGSDIIDITNAPALVNTDPSWSPSGNYIVYSAGGPGIAVANLFVIPASGGAPVRLTHSCGLDGAPGWSPDGSKIAFESAPYDPDLQGSTRIWVIAAPPGIR